MSKLSSLTFIAVMFFLSFSIKSYSQSYFHPHRTGFGYSYAYSANNKVTDNVHTVYGSAGSTDIYLYFSKIHKAASFVDYYGIGINSYKIAENKRWIPSFSASVSRVDRLIFAGFGISISYKAYDDNQFHFIPELSGRIALIKGNEVNLESNGGFASLQAALNLGYSLNNNLILSVTPGFSYGIVSYYSSISAGLIYSLNK